MQAGLGCEGGGGVGGGGSYGFVRTRVCAFSSVYSTAELLSKGASVCVCVCVDAYKQMEEASPPQLLSSVRAVRSSLGTSSQPVFSRSGSAPRTSPPPPPTLPVSQVTGDSWIFILSVCTTIRVEEKGVLSEKRQAACEHTL